MPAERQGFKNWEEANADSNMPKIMDFRPGENLEPMKNEAEKLTEEQKNAGLERLADLAAKMEITAEGSEKEKISREILKMLTTKSARKFLEMKNNANA